MKGGKDAVTGGTVERQGTTSFGGGKHWDGLITDRASAMKAGVKTKEIDTILGRIQRAKRLIKGNIRADADGNLYKFDPAHQSAKVHLEKIVERTDGFYGVAEVDPVNGVVTKVLKQQRRLGK